MTNLPCIDCITLSICKAEAARYNFEKLALANRLTDQISLLNSLSKKCSLIIPYLNKQSVPFDDPDLLFHIFDCDEDRIKETVKFLLEGLDDDIIL